jgi:ABC-2 type transport system permease protein
MEQTAVFRGALRYEFLMQIRRPALWIVFAIVGLFFVISHQPWYRPVSSSVDDAVTYWTGVAHGILAIVVGVMLADRVSRDRSTRTEELLVTYNGSLGARLSGKYLGSTLATLLPMFLIYAIGVGYIVYRWHAPQVIPFSFVTFSAIAVPGLLCIGAFSIAIPAFIWPPLYQFLFVGYWFWGNLLPGNIGIPSLSDTIFTPIGGSMCTGFFNAQGREAVCNPGIQGATVTQGVESIVLLIGLGMLALLMLIALLKMQERRA